MLVVNFFAGAGAGKSTIASEVFWKLKKLGYSTELVGEYAKEAIIKNKTNVRIQLLNGGFCHWIYLPKIHSKHAM